MRRHPFQQPAIAPYLVTAVMKYWLQVGWKRQFLPNSGLSSSWYRRTTTISSLATAEGVCW